MSAMSEKPKVNSFGKFKHYFFRSLKPGLILYNSTVAAFEKKIKFFLTYICKKHTLICKKFNRGVSRGKKSKTLKFSSKIVYCCVTRLNDNSNVLL